MFDIRQKKIFLKLPESWPYANTQTSCSECMAWDEGRVIHPTAWSSGHAMYLPFCSQTGIFLACYYPSHTDKHVFLSKKLWSKLKVLTGEAAGFSGWASKSGFFSYSLYWLCVSSLTLSCTLYLFPLPLSYCSVSGVQNLCFFLCVLSATVYAEPSKSNICEALIEMRLPRGHNLASFPMLAASCEGGHLQIWWNNVDLHQWPFSASEGNGKLPASPCGLQDAAALGCCCSVCHCVCLPASPPLAALRCREPSRSPV